MNDKAKRRAKFLGLFFLAALAIGLAAQPLSAQVTIPQGSTINSALLHIYVAEPTGRPVTVHRITTEWAETVVTYNSFMNNFALASEGGFTPDVIGWKVVDITSLVQAWAAGIYPNYGIVIAEPVEGTSFVMTTLRSSEYLLNPALRPKLVINYTPPGGIATSMTIQRPGAAAEQVVDTWVNGLHPDLNYGISVELVIRNYQGVNKYALIRFIFAFTPSCPGTGTPGYWMNHPEAWPEDSILIGGLTYSKQDAIALMMSAVAGDKTYTMFPALVAAKLNAEIGCATICPDGTNIGATITAADAWMSLYPVGSGVPAGGAQSPWRRGEPLYFVLDQYNNGLLCVPHRD